jgi:4-amino-4-deoxy-L-arabinose transferase-like glycosyltransferase
MEKRKPLTILLVVLCLGIALRLVGLNWDQNNHLHPDERFLTMVTQSLRWPTSLTQYFSTSASPANPHNYGYPFFVYGTLPVFITKLVSQLVNLDTYTGITLVGRALSAVLDTLVIFLVWAISFRIYKRPAVAVLSALFYALSVLPIQLSHFYAVDTFMVTALYGALYLLHRLMDSSNLTHPLLSALALGIFLGLALAAKISAILFLPVVACGFIYSLIKNRNLSQLVIAGLILGLSCFVTLRLAQPYLFSGLFTVNPKVLANWQQLKAFADPASLFPPGVQWLYTLPLVFPLANLVWWGLGLFMATIALVGIIYSIAKIKNFPHFGLHLLWVLGLFTYQGIQFAKPMRYFYPLYPSLAVISGPILFLIFSRVKSGWLKALLVCLLILWPLAFVSVYSRPHSRVAASDWIYTHLPAGSTLSCEYWDDCLPLGGSGPYRIIEYPLYDPDTAQKWLQMQTRLSQTDYLILSSNRLYGSIMTAPEKYPVTQKFYSDLFAGRLGFTKIAEFTSRPNLPLPGFHLCLTPPFINYGKVAYPSQACSLPGISFVDDYADESWTVYDHPKVIIFSRL